MFWNVVFEACQSQEGFSCLSVFVYSWGLVSDCFISDPVLLVLVANPLAPEPLQWSSLCQDITHSSRYGSSLSLTLTLEDVLHTANTRLLSDAAGVGSSGQYGHAHEAPHQRPFPQPHPTARHAGQQDCHHPLATLPQSGAWTAPQHTSLQPWAWREGPWGRCEGEPPTVSIGNGISCTSFLFSCCMMFS